MINIESNEDRINYLHQKIDELLSELKYDELCGFLFMVFETNRKEIFTIAECEGLINPEDIMMYLSHLQFIKKVMAGIYFKPNK